MVIRSASQSLIVHCKLSIAVRSDLSIPLPIMRRALCRKLSQYLDETFSNDEECVRCLERPYTICMNLLCEGRTGKVSLLTHQGDVAKYCPVGLALHQEEI